jgi:hypothetical protein
MDINNYCLSRPVIDINIIQDTINVINKIEQIRENYKFIMDDVQLVLHPHVDGDVIDVVKKIS